MTIAISDLLPLASYAFVMAITPGPNNLMLASSGIRFGFRQTLQHWIGINVGFIVLLALCAVGIGALIVSLPLASPIMKGLGSAYLLYLAWTMRPNVFDIDHEQEGQPMSFLAAALFQFANPKAWIMTISASAMFIPPVTPQWLAIALLLLTFIVVGMPCGGAWLLAGSAIRRHLSSPKARNITALVMVLLILYTALGIWL